MSLVRASWFGALSLAALLLAGCRSAAPQDSSTADSNTPPPPAAATTSQASTASTSSPHTTTTNAPPVASTTLPPPTPSDFEKQREAEKRYLYAPLLKPPVSDCAHPVGLLPFATASVAEQAAIVAQVVRVFPEFRLLTEGEPDEPFELRIAHATFIPGGAYEPEKRSDRYAAFVRCGDALTCARFLPLAAIATTHGHGRGCERLEGLRVEEPWPALPAATERPSGAAACARTRLCSATTIGGTWSCGTFRPPEIERCAAHSNCDEVVSCLRSLTALGAGPGTPKTEPRFPPEW